MKLRIATCVVLIGYSLPANANVCDRVLRTDVFNIGYKKDTRRYLNHLKYQMCSTKWSTKSEFENLAKSNRFGLSFVTKKFGLSGSFGDSRSRENAAYAASYNRYCVSDDKLNVNFSDLTEFSRVSDFAVQSWVECLRISSNRQGLFVTVRTHENYKAFDVIFNRKSNGPSGWQITGLLKADYKIVCKHDGNIIDPSSEKPLNFVKSQEVIQCTKNPEETVEISVSTSAGVKAGIVGRGTKLTNSETEQILSQLEYLEQNDKIILARLANIRQKMLTVESGTVFCNTGGVRAHTNLTGKWESLPTCPKSIKFSRKFRSVPILLVAPFTVYKPESSTRDVSWTIWQSSVSNEGFTVDMKTLGGLMNSISVRWIAIGAR